MAADEQDDRGSEFWEEQAREDGPDLRRQILRWLLLFAGLTAAAVFVLWWSGSALHYTASRLDNSAAAGYKVSGIVRDSMSGAAIAWARVADTGEGKPPHFETTADREGKFELITISEPHRIQASALGYRPALIAVGRAWYMWMPKGAEHIDIHLQPER